MYQRIDQGVMIVKFLKVTKCERDLDKQLYIHST